MKKFALLFSVLLLISCSSQVVKENSTEPKVSFYVDITDISDDLFNVTVTTKNLTDKNSVYNFAATVPGTYSVLDFGRLVKTFKAYDENGDELNVEKLSTNKWKIENPQKLYQLKYDIEDSFDAGLEEYPISPMCGSGIEENFVAINTFAIAGYFEGLQSLPVEIEIAYNSDWEIGTALPKKSENIYYAETYDHFADSPILVGDLTVAETFVNNISVQVYVSSPDTSINAEMVLSLAENMLQSASGFIGYSPVKEYKFLMCVVDQETYSRNGLYGTGALEHSYSSLYVSTNSPREIQGLKNTMAHEFLHILTPLFLHSEVIHAFNFEEPTPSQHIWLYEGVTEWASDIMQLRSGVMNIDDYMQTITTKLRMNDYFDQSISLKEMALTSYGISGYGNFLNFYEKGAVTAAILDLLILDLSNGKKGFREIFLLLLKKYGKYKPFSEENFFKTLENETYPEVGEFLKNHVIDSKPLPFEKYYNKIGFDYIPSKLSEDTRPSIATNISLNGKSELITMHVQDIAKDWGIEENDVILEVIGKEMSLQSIRDILQEVRSMQIGDPFTMKLKRGNEVIEINGELQPILEKHLFISRENLTEREKMLRDSWSKNL